MEPGPPHVVGEWDSQAYSEKAKQKAGKQRETKRNPEVTLGQTGLGTRREQQAEDESVTGLCNIWIQ